MARAESRQRNHLERMIQQDTENRTGEYWMEPNTRNGIAASEVLEGLDSLEPEQREIIIARVWGELTFEELAELMNCSSASAYRRYVSALTELKHSVLAASTPHNNKNNTGK